MVHSAPLLKNRRRTFTFQGRARFWPAGSGRANSDLTHANSAGAQPFSHRLFAASSDSRASTQRSPSGVASFFQNGASVLR